MSSAAPSPTSRAPTCWAGKIAAETAGPAQGGLSPGRRESARHGRGLSPGRRRSARARPGGLSTAAVRQRLVPRPVLRLVPRLVR